MNSSPARDDSHLLVFAGLRILFQLRPNAFTHRGGDTVLLERYREELTKQGARVVVDLEHREDPKNFDLIHLFNFATPALLLQEAQAAVVARIPFVVTTLNEDLPKFHSQAHAQAKFLTGYVASSQDAIWYATNMPNLEELRPAPSFENHWVVEHASGLLVNGFGEQASLEAQYGELPNVRVVPVGFDQAPASPELFVNNYGMQDFVLCVGRLEHRKNQLLLLKVLEHIDLPVVLVGGGFSYQPDYENAVRSFRRRGQTLLVGRLDDAMLASAYAAARVHVLPSWYELPGLVSLEAAYHGCQIVATATGTTVDYLGDFAWYAEPDDEYSLLHAILGAYYSPPKEGLREHVARYSWHESVLSLADSYIAALDDGRRRCGKGDNTTNSLRVPSTVTLDRDKISGVQAVSGAPVPPYGQGQSLSQAKSAPLDDGPSKAPQRSPHFELDASAKLNQGDQSAREGDFEGALRHFQEALTLGGVEARALRSIGAMNLALGKLKEAREAFLGSLARDPQDLKALRGAGIVHVRLRELVEGKRCFDEILAQDPFDLATIYHLIEVSYPLGELQDLKSALTKFLIRHPDNIDIRYCLAGCLFKMNATREAEREIDEVLKANPDHRGAQELSELLRREQQPSLPKPTVMSPSLPLIRSPETERENQQQVNLATMPADAQDNSEAHEITEVGEVDDAILKAEREKKEGKLEVAATTAQEMLRRRSLSNDQKERFTVILGEIRSLQEQLSEALELFESVLSTNDRSTRAWCGKGALAAYSGEWLKAESCFRRAAQLDPASDTAYAGLGLCSRQRGDLGEAWQYFVKARAINPENPRALVGLVEIAYQSKRLDELEGFLKEYLIRQPLDLEMRYSLAGCLYALGKTKDSKQEVDYILAERPQHERAKELAYLIDNGPATRAATG